MQQAQTSMQNPMAQPVPSGGGIPNIAQYPVIQKIIQGLGQIASSYGWTGQTPQERLERTQMEQQKAEALARLSQSQQQIGYEGQRVGFEGQRTAADVEASKAAAKRSNVEAEQAPLRTAIESRNADVNKQRADQAYEAEKQRLKMEADKYAAE
jgi:hypothetical protein